jgi:cyclic-di-GMP-binding biofilm dispersal mediator protein
VAFGSAAETPAAITERLMRVNFLGQVAVASALLPALERSAAAGNAPFVVSISGVIAETPMAGLSSYSASKTALHGYATAATRELRRAGIRWVDARPGHTESGLASRAIFGAAPAFGAGLQTEVVVSRIVKAILEDEKDLPSTAFAS